MTRIVGLRALTYIYHRNTYQNMVVKIGSASIFSTQCLPLRAYGYNGRMNIFSYFPT